MRTTMLRSAWIRFGFLSLCLALALTYSKAAFSQAIRIQDESGVDLVVFYPDGNISILYGTILMGPEADLTSDPGIGEFLITNALDQVVFRIPSDTGHVHLKGTVEQDISTTLNPSAPAFKVEDSTGQLVAYIDDAGNLKTKGIIFLQGVPTNGVTQMGNTFIRNEGDFNYTDFTSTAGLTLTDDAAVVNAKIHIVPGQTLTKGAVWRSEKVYVANGFEAVFDFRFDSDGADGLSFVIQNQSATPSLTSGGGMGYTGIVDSLAVEFDTWKNLDHIPPESNGNHISVNTGGPGQPNSSLPTHSIGSNFSPSTTLEDGSVHTARIVYDPHGSTFEVYLNDTLEVQISPFDLEDHLNLDDGAAWVGIMSTSGGAAAHVTELPNFGFTRERTIVIILSGEQPPFHPSDNIDTGIFEWGMGLRDDPGGRYFAAMFNEDAVDNKGAGRVREWIKIGLEEGWFGGINRFAFVGHSHGGGSVHDLADYLTLHVDNAALRAEFDYEIVMTGYVDAIGQSFPFFACETRLPPGTAYHVNLFQRLPISSESPVRGCTMIPVPGADVDIDVNTQLIDVNTNDHCVNNTGHFEIDDCEVVLRVLDRNLDFAASGEPLDTDYCAGELACNN